MTARYFSAVPIEAPHVVLDGSEAHHLARVMRIGPGQQVTLFDGRGGEYLAAVQTIDRRRVELCVERFIDVERELPQTVTIAAALPKGDRQRWMIEKLVELGVSRFVPLLTARSSVRPASGTFPKLERAVIEASKQCGRNRLMTIEPIAALADFVTRSAGDERRWLAHPGEAVSPRTGHTPDVWRRLDRPISIAIGPEGGFSPEEVELAAERGWEMLRLGGRTLRIETAAVASATLAAAALADVRLPAPADNTTPTENEF